MKFLACFCFLLFFYTLRAQQKETVTLGKIQLGFSLDRDGEPVYAVDFAGKAVVLPSRLGLSLRKTAPFTKDLFSGVWNGNRSI